MSSEQVVLVDSNDQKVGQEDKLAAHQRGLLHRAFSVFVIRKTTNNGYEILLQQRASAKYHSGNLWSNSCCSHPRPNEDIITAGQRRLNEELGLNLSLKSCGHFIYKAELDNDLTEHELDHVLYAIYEDETQTIKINKQEAQDYRWINRDQLRLELDSCPNKFTAWLEPALALLPEFNN